MDKIKFEPWIPEPIDENNRKDLFELNFYINDEEIKGLNEGVTDVYMSPSEIFIIVKYTKLFKTLDSRFMISQVNNVKLTLCDREGYITEVKGYNGSMERIYPAAYSYDINSYNDNFMLIFKI